MAVLAAIADRLVSAVEGAEWLDRPSYRLEHGFALTLNLFGEATGAVRDALNGTWLGHPVHPPLTDIPVGAWTVAIVLDGVDAVRPGPAQHAEAARTSVGLGLLGAAGAALTGLGDWQYTQDNARRVGLVHGVLNLAATGLFTCSWMDRHRDHAARARALGAAGYLVATGSAYLGGTLVSGHRIGVDHADRGLEPRRFVDVLDASELAEGRPHRVEADGTAIVLVRTGTEVHALGEHCPHLGGPLAQGWLHAGALVCPWHGSRFALDTGRPVNGPATVAAPCFETRTRDGRVQVRRRVPVPTAAPGSVVDREQVQPRHAARAEGPGLATEVLRAHHDQLRGLMRTVGRAELPTIERERVLDELVAELSLHEQIEDEVFYPAMRDVSALVTISHAEHRQLDDQVVVVLRIGATSERFAEELGVLVSAFEHHAGLEETEMFPEVEAKLDQAWLDELGRRLAARLERLRGSALTRARLRAKRTLIRRL